MEPREHLGMLLDWHDGDDRCGCLAELVGVVVDGDVDLAGAVEWVSQCLAEHPAGLTMRTAFTRGVTHD